MANTGVKGKFIDKDTENGIPGLTIIAYDVEAILTDVELGEATTNTKGEFLIEYSISEYGLEENPDIKICAYNSFKRLLYQSEEKQDVTAPILDLGERKIPKADREGWLVTLLKGETPNSEGISSKMMLSKNNVIKPLVDNEDAWKDLTTYVTKEPKYIYLTNIYFEIPDKYDKFPTLITVFHPNVPQEGNASTGKDLGERLEERLLEANIDVYRKVDVRLLIYHGSPVIHNKGVLSYDDVKEYFSDAPNQPNNVKVLGLGRFPWQGSLHAKLVVGSEKAYLIGSPLSQECYDDNEHRIDNPRRGKMKYGIPMAVLWPFHDVSISILGPAVEYLGKTFDLLWKKVGGSDCQTLSSIGEDNGDLVQIVRTIPGGLLPSLPDGEMGILEAYQRAIENSEDFIYLENQYFTESSIMDSLYLALKSKSGLQVIMVINDQPDGPKYPNLQNTLINRLIKQLTDIEAQDRLGIFTLWSHAPALHQRIIRNYVHSKVGIVDNRWATVGSANLDGIGLKLSQVGVGIVSKKDVSEMRAIEVNAVIYNNVDGQSKSTFPDDLRRTLWAEHLGFDANGAELETKPSEGWLSLWNERAEAKLADLNASPPSGHPARILKWTGKKKAIEHLKSIGVNKNQVGVKGGSEERLGDLLVMNELYSFSFKHGKWKRPKNPWVSEVP